jgi:hypothetical protein
MLAVKNPLSDFEVREKAVINPSATVKQAESSSPDDPHRLNLKWEGSKKQSTLTVLCEVEAKQTLKKKSRKKIDEFTPHHYTTQDSGAFAPILCIECRGLEPTAYFPGDEFVVILEGGTVFAEEVSVGDWADYDAENDAPVALFEVEFKWEAICFTYSRTGPRFAGQWPKSTPVCL